MIIGDKSELFEVVSQIFFTGVMGYTANKEPREV